MDADGSAGAGDPDDLAVYDLSVPADVDPHALGSYCLMLGDDALVYSYRLQQWMTRAPGLEEEAALGNIALDLLGQARVLLARAGHADGTGRGADVLAFSRTESQFRNVRLVERYDEDFAELVGRLLVFATWRLALFDGLCRSADPVLAAVAGSAVKEMTYHRDHAAQWVVRLGTGTELSHTRMQAGLEIVWPLVEELFAAHPVEMSLPGVAADVTVLRPEFDTVIGTVLGAGGLERPATGPLATGIGAGTGTGRDGVHTDAMTHVLTELLAVPAGDPDAPA